MTDERDERDEFVALSLADLDREHEAGDLSDADHAELRARYEGATASSPTPPPRRRPGFVVAAGAFVIVVAVAAGVLVAQAVGRRDAGDAITGAIATVTTAAPEGALSPDVGACIDAEGVDASTALDCYLVLTTETAPGDAVGFAYFGWWLTRQSFQQEDAELARAAESTLDRAVELDPALPEARVFRVVLYERSGRVEEARAELAALDALDPPQQVLDLVAPVRERLGQAP